MATKKRLNVLASTARGTGTFNDTIDNDDDHLGMALFLDITAASGTTPTLDIKVQYLDPLTGNAFDLLAGAFVQKTTTGSDHLVIYPGIAVDANRVNQVLPGDIRINSVIGGTTPSFTYSLTAILF